ncbi:MAG TPA: ABC transporter [Desulfosporosinus sp.]|nr:ABC transporter [Desulfosporosinus sp.]
MSVIQCQNVTRSYGKLKAIDNLSFAIEENKLTGLIGRNGAGKTTLLKLLAGYLKPTSGEIEVFSQKPFNNLEGSSKTMFVNDTMTFPDSFTLIDILSEVAPFYANWNSNLAKGLLDYFSINPKQPHSKLSKGSKSTFNSILGIASRCPLTIFDEPTSGMDSAVRKDFYKALLKDYLEYPRSIILSSHLINEVEGILEDILLLNQGVKSLHLPVLELKKFAIGLRGNAQVIQRFVEGKELIYQEEFAKGYLYVVLRSELIQPELKLVRQSGLDVLSISTDDLCIYLTAKSRGGIDYVFKRS